MNLDAPFEKEVADTLVLNEEMFEKDLRTRSADYSQFPLITSQEAEALGGTSIIQ